MDRETQLATGYIDLNRRFFDPLTGRFTSIDPVTEGQEDQSTYQYSWNNPILRSDPNGSFPEGPGDDPFLIGKLITTAGYDIKHAAYNTAFRFAGVPLRAGYAEENGHQVFETKFSSPTTDNSLIGQSKEAVNALTDLALAASAGSSPANPGNLLSKTSVESQVVKTIKEGTEFVPVINSQKVVGTTRASHRQGANKELMNQMKENPNFKGQLDAYFGTNLSQAMKSTKSGSLLNPPNTQWHHPVGSSEKGSLWLLDKNIHRDPSLQKILHPNNGKGGFSEGNF